MSYDGRANVWIRKADRDKWDALEFGQRAKLISNALNGLSNGVKQTVIRKDPQGRGVEVLTEPVIKTKDDAEKEARKMIKKSIKRKGVSEYPATCEHNFTKGNCLNPKCKFSRYK